jgi:hypothetical protein
MPILPFPEYAPDISPFGEEESQVIQNVYPRKDGYGPVMSPVVYSSALAGACRGAFYARNADSSVSLFAATSTKLYRLSNTNATWTDVSKGSGTYSAVPTGDQWQFAQFNNFVIAVQINSAPQVFDLTSSTNFADLAGSPPQARYVAIVNRFVVLSGLGSSTPYRIQWSDQNAITTWTAGVGQSDFQDLPDGGIVRSLGGGDSSGLITQDAALRAMIYAPGSPVIFQIERISHDKGIFAPLSLVRAGNYVFFCGNDGFQMFQPGAIASAAAPTYIGKERVDRTFFADVDSSNLQMMIGASDPQKTRVYFAYKSLAGQAGLFDKVLVYDYALDRWAIILGWMGQYLFSSAQPGLTLESLDAFAPGIITISAAADNGSGLIRLTISGLTAGTGPSNTNLHNENSVEIYGVVTGSGPVINGNWPFTIINSTHIDLVGSSSTGVNYTSGGAIGGSLDQLSFSLDSVATGSLTSLSLVDSLSKVNFITGTALEAFMDSSEHEPGGDGRRIRVKGFRPITDATTCLGSVGARENTQSMPIYSTEETVNSKGLCIAKVSTRLARGRIHVPAGATWTFATGIEPLLSQEGKR